MYTLEFYGTGSGTLCYATLPNFPVPRKGEVVFIPAGPRFTSRRVVVEEVRYIYHDVEQPVVKVYGTIYDPV